MNNIRKHFEFEVRRGFAEVRKYEAIVRDACKSGRQPNPDIITSLERAQGALLGLLSEADGAELPIGEILISVNEIYQE